MIKKFAYILFDIIVLILFTILTQIGGVVYLISKIANTKIKQKWQKVVVFISSYLLATFLVVPFLAPFFGRERIISHQFIRPTTYLTVLANRNYVRPALNDLLLKTAITLNKESEVVEIQYLDANFPFFDNFPLIPHLSHHDGRKIDISFLYEKNGNLTNQKKSISGYGVFAEPTSTEFNQTTVCESKGYFQYSFSRFLTLGSINDDLDFSESYTKLLVETLLQDIRVDKIFVEQHLKTRMKLSDSRIRFQGCRSVRHDDHIHLQIK